MNILIIGDSWGVPNYEDKIRGAKPEEHTEFRLKELGYTVFNYALNAGSNQKSMDRVDFSTLPSIDWVVWFHTECLRNNFDANKTIYENLIYQSHETYKCAQQFFSNTNSKTIIIGGQAAIGPTVREIFDTYLNPDYLIDDWRSEILNEKMPECYTVSKVDWIKNSIDTPEEKYNLLNAHDTVWTAMIKSDKFQDDCHPGVVAHAELTIRLHKIFSLE